MTTGRDPAVGPGLGATSVAVLDIDGVLADVTHRRHFLERRPKDWESFFARADDDPPLIQGLELARRLAAEHQIVYLTGRPHRLRAVTQRWLEQHSLPPGPLVMRRGGDYRPARIAKLEIVRAMAAEYSIAVIVDDDPAVVQAMQSAGFAVLLADWGDPGRAVHQAQEQDGRT